MLCVLLFQHATSKSSSLVDFLSFSTGGRTIVRQISISMAAGTAFIILNVLRLFSVLSLIAVCTASVMIIVIEAQHFSFFFFSIMSQVFQIVSCFFLIASEIPNQTTSRFLEQKVAILAQGSSLAYTGWPMIVLATGVFAELRLAFLKTERIGSALRAIIIVAGSSTSLIGVTYAILPIIFWKLPAGECRRARKDGAVGDPRVKSDARYDPEFGSSDAQFMQISRPIIGSESGGSVSSSRTGTSQSSIVPFSVFAAEKKAYARAHELDD